MADRWARDPGIRELIDYFDQPEHCAWHLLTDKEAAILHEEIRRCADPDTGFQYISRNYFWISTKDGSDTLMRLKEPQELVWETIQRLRARGRGVKLLIIKARQLYCLDPKTRVLTSDMRWVPIDDLLVGHELVACDEEIPGGRGNGRKLRKSKVTAKQYTYAEAYRITLDNGQTLIATGDHRFLCKRRGGDEAVWRYVNHKEFDKKNSSPIMPGDEIRRITTPWGPSDAEDGWFGGLMDGEGSIAANRKGGGVAASVSQNLGPVLDRARAYLQANGYTFHESVDRRPPSEKPNGKFGGKEVGRLTLNRMGEMFRLFGQCRPTRFLDSSWWEGKDLPGRCGESWSKVVSVEPIGMQRMVDISTTTGTFIAEGFVSHNCSTLIDAIIAWLSMFNPNNRGLVVSYDETHAAYLFSVILHIYDQLPWWLRPMIGQRKYEEGIHLINPDPDLRRLEPGLNSRIVVQGAKQYVGIGEGRVINSAHLSEFGSWDPARARQVIIGDFRWALPDAPNTFAVLETRVRQASKFAERLWESQVELGDVATWYPLFMPIYFDKSHFVAPKGGWKPEPEEIAVKDRAAEEWCVCSGCGQIRPAQFGGESTVGVTCKDCRKGTYTPYVLQEGQMRWLWEQRLNAEKLGEKAVIEMQQSLATNPQEAFAHVTETVFSKAARDWVAATTRGDCLARGYMAGDGTFHAPRRMHGQESAQCWAHGCREDHTGQTDRHLRIWQPPVRGARYAVGVDVAAGYGGARDYSVITVNRIGRLPEPDIQVATYRCNTISAWHLTDLANAVGRWYNNALMVVDYTNFQTVGDRLLNYFKYPNLYQWRNPDAVKQQSNRWHWVWNNKNKEGAWQVLDGWLRDHSFIAKDPVFAKEMRHFQRRPDGTLGAPDAGDDDDGADFEKIYDDTVTCMIQTVIAAHQIDPQRRELPIPQEEGLRAAGAWRGMCAKCGKHFAAERPCERDRCPFCGSCWLSWKMDTPEPGPPLGFKFDDMGGMPGAVRDRLGVTEEFSFGEGSYGQE